MRRRSRWSSVARPMRPIDILIAGFGPFPGAPVNISAELAARLARIATYRWPHLRAVPLALETDWRRGPDALSEAMSSLRPKSVVMFGISRGAMGFQVETCAWNERRDRSDALAHPNRGQCLAVPVCPRHAAAPALHVGPLADRIVMRLRGNGFAARRSNDAGRYLCNAALFHGLAAARQGLARQTVFVHIPPIISGLGPAGMKGHGNRMQLATALRGGLEIIAACTDNAGPGLSEFGLAGARPLLDRQAPQQLLLIARNEWREGT